MSSAGIFLTGSSTNSHKKLKIISVVGTRPNFIKIAPLCREFQKVNSCIEHLLVHTGQHYDVDMDRDFFESLHIPAPDINLEVGSGSQSAQVAQIMTKFESYCLQHKPDWVVVVGDVNSTLACSLVTKKIGVKLAHVEAGLRSFDMTMPEEINRKVTDCIADIFFTPSLDADENLISEGIHRDRIKRVGNIMIDTLVAELEKAQNLMTYERWGLRRKQFIYVTLHRPSNVDDQGTLSSILDIFSVVSKKMPLVLPLHPRTFRRIDEFGLGDKILREPDIHTTSPLSYHESINLAQSAKLVVTDSGGLQEETTYLGTPCMTLRPNTERPITITHGTNRLTSLKRLLGDMNAWIKKEIRMDTPCSALPLWDGKTAERIASFFLDLVR